MLHQGNNLELDYQSANGRHWYVVTESGEARNFVKGVQDFLYTYENTF